jgi:D-sedoheptulose 7-phosphate isomerase
MSSSSSPTAQIFGKSIAEHLEIIRQIQDQQAVLESIARAIAAALRAGRKILWCGNWGSATDSQHLAAEIVGSFRREHRGLPSIALTTDTSILTPVGNDYGYEAVFSRQVEALGNPGDPLAGVSNSGNSQNVVGALTAARARSIATVAFTGAGGRELATLAEHLFAVDSRDTALIHETHILAGHMLCDGIELDLVQVHAPATTYVEVSQ